MNKTEFIAYLEKTIYGILRDVNFKNYKNQIFVEKLGANFNQTYKLDFILNKVLFIETASCFLLQENHTNKIATIGLTGCAEIYEYLSQIEKIKQTHDTEYFQILSALCYDLSGYQANAYCISKKIEKYQLTTTNQNINLTEDNKIINHILLILQKKIPLAHQSLNSEREQKTLQYDLLLKALNSWYENILYLKNDDTNIKFHTAYKAYLLTNNIYLAQLLLLLQTRVQLFENRSIAKIIIQNIDTEEKKIWKKYIKLLSNDTYENERIKKHEERKSKFEFWISQIRAIEDGLLSKNENFVIQMPTSAGKTFLAELYILKNLLENTGKKAMYISPFNALSTEKENELGEYLSKLGFCVSVLSGSYEIDEFQNVFLHEADILIATPEKTDLFLRTNPDFFDNIACIVVDEGHIIGDLSTRASLMEFLLIRLKIKIPDIKILFISAVMPPINAEEYAQWLARNNDNVLRSKLFSDSIPAREWEPTKKIISCLRIKNGNGNIYFQNNQTTHNGESAYIVGFVRGKEFFDIFPAINSKPQFTVALAYKKSLAGCTLVFCATPRKVKTIADNFEKLFSLFDENNKKTTPQFEINQNTKSFFYANEWFGQEHFITKSISRGIGVHYGDLPTQVRNAVEDDYKNGKFSILIATSSVGQGINFPIKSLIVYDLIINQDPKNYKETQKRDFWNIVGRAGRAGKETEGEVLFMVNTTNDSNLYSAFTNKLNIEPANSLIFKLLTMFAAKRVDESFFEYLTELTETYLLDLITEEAIENDFEIILDAIIENSLFKVQAEKSNIDIIQIKEGMRTVFSNVKDEATVTERKVFKTSGLSLKSNKYILNYVEENLDSIIDCIEESQFLELLLHFLVMIKGENISELVSDHKLKNLYKNVNNDATIFYESIVAWINEKSISEITKIWIDTTKLDNDDFFVFLSKALNYLYPWVITAFLSIVAFKLEKQLQELPEDIKNLPSYIKYGVNNKLACLALSLGIKNRNIAQELNVRCPNKTNESFIVWLANVDFSEIDSMNIHQYEKENIKLVISKLSIKNITEYSTDLVFQIRGIYFDQNSKVLSKQIQIGDKLECVREYSNEFDPFAVKILKNNIFLGYVPREYTKKIATDIDIDNAEYDIKVIKITDKGSYSEITVSMSLIYEI